MDISQNKALEEMGFERPEPNKAPNKWNNAKNHEAEEKLNATKEKLAKASAELVTEEMKNKEISDTNIFGRPRKIEVTAQEYRSWQKSAETNIEAIKEEITNGENIDNLVSTIAEQASQRIVARRTR